MPDISGSQDVIRCPVGSGFLLGVNKTQTLPTTLTFFPSALSSYLACAVSSFYNGSVCISFALFAKLCYDDFQLTKDNRTQQYLPTPLSALPQRFSIKCHHAIYLV